jgi:hypothetical protein
MRNTIKKDSRSFYAYVRSKQRSEVKVGPLKDGTGNIISDSRTATDLLNDYFASAFAVENSSFIPDPISDFDFTNSQLLKEICCDERREINFRQNKYRRGHSTEAAFFRSTNDLRCDMDKSVATCLSSTGLCIKIIKIEIALVRTPSRGVFL